MDKKQHYFGLSIEGVLFSGSDVLAEKALAGGPITYESLKGALPPIERGRYCFLAGPSSWQGLIARPDGRVYPHGTLEGPNPPAMYDPYEGLPDAYAGEGGEGGDPRVSQGYEKGWIPVLTTVIKPRRRGGVGSGRDAGVGSGCDAEAGPAHAGAAEGGNAPPYPDLTVTCFVEFGETGHIPRLWVSQRYEGGGRGEMLRRVDGTPAAEGFFVVKAMAGGSRRRTVDEAEFEEARRATISEWVKLSEGFDRFRLPHVEIEAGLKAMAAGILSTFAGDHAHYGHHNYGHAEHDNFPPTYLYAVELFMTLGMLGRARELLSHMLRFCVGSDGRFHYRQGRGEVYGASASEYGRLFWLSSRLHTADPRRSLFAAPGRGGTENPSPGDGDGNPSVHGERLRFQGGGTDFMGVLLTMGGYLTGRITPDGSGSRALVRMCAEADNHSEVHAYAGNNLWAVRGLRALAGMAGRLGYACAPNIAGRAEALWHDLRSALDDERVPSPYGDLVPFRLGYPTLPISLSAGPYNIGDGRYAGPGGAQGGQSLHENTYANYRYYAEMLSSGLLRKGECDAIEAMRGALGGRLLGMTRLFGHLDDWPADNYARHYLESDVKDGYALLYFSHILFHGNLDTGVYYEQVTADGAAVAADCVPVTALAPLMTAWMFAYEPVDCGEVYLLRGVPGYWYGLGEAFGAEGLVCPSGRFSVSYEPAADPGGPPLERGHVKAIADASAECGPGSGYTGTGYKELNVRIKLRRTGASVTLCASLPGGDVKVYVDLPESDPDYLVASGAALRRTGVCGRYAIMG
ncbi:MAG: hypothetical protein FWE70_06230 [Oscillospiraceae bacterium]|nr:hypothetical protein [Oscillospiraceae bacterium]